jgi:hypothetical protein
MQEYRILSRLTDKKELDRAIALAGQLVEQGKELQEILGYKEFASTAEALLDLFKAEMLAKLQKRAAKHPDDNFLALSIEDLMNYPLAPIMEHMNLEIEELYVARAFPGKDQYTGKVEDPKMEDVDVANMAFIEWAIRKVQEPVT